MKRMGIFVLVSVSLVGCSLFRSDDNESTLKLPKPKTSHDSIGVELTFVRIPVKETSVEQSIWAETDEQCVDPEVRVHLQRNGFRCGLVNQQLPTRLRQLLDESKTENAISMDAVDLLTRTRYQTWRSGKRSLIMATPIKNHFVCLRTDADTNLLTGQTYPEAQGFFAVRAYPQGDGRVRIELLPEVHHGPIKNQYVASEGSLQIQSGRERLVVSDMAIETVLASGQTLLLSCTSDWKGLGRTFFVDDENGEPHQKLLLLRLVHTQKDDLFDSLLEE